MLNQQYSDKKRHAVCPSPLHSAIANIDALNSTAQQVHSYGLAAAICRFQIATSSRLSTGELDMISSIRTKILLIAAGTVIFSLALTSGVIYALVRTDNLHTIHQNLEALTTANALAKNGRVCGLNATSVL